MAVPHLYPPFSRAGDQPSGWWWVSSASCVSIQQHLPLADGFLRPLTADKKRSCEEMNPHFFTAPYFLSLFTPVSKKQEEKGILPPFPQKLAF
jgi:hypothetical protein